LSPNIELRDYSFRASDTETWLLKNISLKIEPGERLGITGPSGSGKSTLCHVLAGLQSLTLHGSSSGSLLIAGSKIVQPTTLSLEEKFHPIRTGFVLQNPESQIFSDTIIDEIQYGLHDCSEEKALQTLRSVQMEDLAYHSTQTLSLGQKQRLVIAAFLAADPELLILDEPTNFLDAAGAEQLFTLLKTLPMTQIIIEHDLERLCEYSDYIIELENGMIVAEGTPTEWLCKTKHHPRFYQVASAFYTDTALEASVPSILLTKLHRKEIINVTFNSPRKVKDSEQSIILCNDITCGYQSGTPILRQISFTASAGERIALLGLNGSGKTTLLKCLCGLIEPWEGSVRIAGEKPQPKSTGFVYQNPDYQIFEQTVFDECAFTLRMQHLAEPEIAKRVEFWLKETGLWELRERLPLTLSYGEKRRLTLASVLVAQPHVVLFDEPTTALDNQNVQNLSELFLRLTDQQEIALCFSTHDIDFALDTATRIILLDQGRTLKDLQRTEVTFHDLSILKMPLPFSCKILQNKKANYHPMGTRQFIESMRRQ
jgi:energy-coupling factor transporter ATP-binding protein EcfA2